jgi:group I intron endonuclease
MVTIGIYKIQSLNNPNRCYIGSAKNIFHRWQLHLYQLIRNKHHSIKLQRHFDKYGEVDLQFSILESFNFISKENLLSREQHYINLLNPYFNSSKIAGSRLGVKTSNKTKKIQREVAIRNGNKPPSRKGIHDSKETRQKKSKRMEGNKYSLGFKHSEETNNKKSKFMTGKIPWNKGLKYKLKKSA